VDRASVRAVALRVAALALLLLLVLVAVLSTRTLSRLPDATLYWVRSEATSFTLAPRSRRLGSRDATAYARTAVAALASGPTAEEREAGLSSAVPEGARALEVELRDGLLTVELSPDFASGGGSASMRARLEQVRWTLSQPTWVDEVALRLDDRPLTVLGGEGLIVEERWRRPVDGRLPRW
jgi:spore germination protein GerM